MAQLHPLVLGTANAYVDLPAPQDLPCPPNLAYLALPALLILLYDRHPSIQSARLVKLLINSW